MKPMLACEAPKALTFPVYASPKLDGIRCLINGNVALSRTLKPIPNTYLQRYLATLPLDGLDGELIVGSPTATDVYRKTMSGVMSQDGAPDFKFYVFDFYKFMAECKPFSLRLSSLLSGKSAIEAADRVQMLEQRLIHTDEELLEYEMSKLAEGYEGVILRSVDGLYKFGRSTAKEAYLLKLKRFTDGEAIITGYEELMHNGNVAEVDELGYQKRSSHQENLFPMGVLGALHVCDLKTDIAFKIGTGYTALHRKRIWQQREQLLGAIVKYKHFEIGVKVKPRNPVWLGFRDTIDIELGAAT